MLFTRLQVYNFGPLCGAHALEVRPLDRTRPVILIGGKNGAGKTTFLEAVRLCLFGRRALGARPTLAEYHEYLTQRIYRGERAARRASVGIEFEHGHAGERSVYRVDRGWEQRGQRITEDLLITCDGRPLGGLDRAHWQDFIDNLIPPALAQLFFFDGERIQALAEDDDDQELASSIRGLLGLDVVEQLQTDLTVYLARHARASDDDLESRLAALIEQRQSQAGQQSRLHQDAAGIKARIDHQRAVIRRHEDQLIRDGGAFAQQRTALQAERDQLEAARSAAEEELRQLCAGLLPFAIASSLSRVATAALAREDAAQRDELLHQARRDMAAELEAALADPALWVLDQGDRAAGDLRDALLPRLRRLLGRAAGADGRDHETATPRSVHGLGPAEGARLTLLLRQAEAETGPAARRLSDRIAEIDDRLRRVQAHLDRAPSDEVVRPLLATLQAHHAELAALEQRLATVEGALKELAIADDQARRAVERIEHEIVRERQSSRRIELGARVQQVLRDFYAALSQARLRELEETIERCFNRLARKGDLVGRVTIDPSSFRISLFNREGEPIPKASLSAGEKQIYAVALLWALAQVSGRKLPVIIDTPLGRLDTDHRQNLVSAYLPYAAEQVIVLSTDSEIDRGLARQLTPAVSRSYRLEYDPTEQASHLEPGYFWDGAAPGAIVPLTPKAALGAGDGTRDYRRDAGTIGAPPPPPLESTSSRA